MDKEAIIVALPELEPLKKEHFEACPHVQLGIAEFVAVVTLQPIKGHRVVPVATALCHDCALAVSEAILAALQRLQPRTGS